MQQLDLNLGAAPRACEPPADDLDPPERRQKRQRVVKAALIAFNTEACCINCHILDISDGGAKLLPADAVQCPDEFTLRPRDEAPRKCKVVWRKGGMVGVRFM